MDKTHACGVWRFGSATLRETTLTLDIGGHATALDQSAYLVLRALLLHAGEVVTKEELLQAGWPGRVVLDNSLVKAIGRLRKALGQAGDALLCSVHGYGYRIAVQANYEPPAPESSCDGTPAAFHMPGWRISKALAKSPDLAVLLAEREDGTVAARAFKLAHSSAGLRSLKREVALHGYIQRTRPNLPGLLPLLDWNLTEPPFWVCTPYCGEGNLAQWQPDADGIAALPLDQRLRMFQGLCRTVAELHGLGVLHKDIKPQNLYPVADGDGFNLLLGDLGISGGDLPPGIAASGLALGEATLHEATALSGTALYTAPELLAGHSPTTRSDLYALGVLLFQMITGDLHKSLAPGWEEQVPDILLRADIAWAAHHDPEKRLGDAAQLADRLDALDDRRAADRQRLEQAAKLEEQARKLVQATQRRRWLAATSAILLAGIAATSLMYAQKSAAEKDATTRANESKAIASFLIDDLLVQANPYTSGKRVMSVRDAVDNAAERVNTRFAKQPEIRAALHAAIGRTRMGLAEYEPAVASLEQSIDTYKSLDGEHSRRVADVEVDLCLTRLWAGDVPGADRACTHSHETNTRYGIVSPRERIATAQVRYEQNRLAETVSIMSGQLHHEDVRADPSMLADVHWFLGLANTDLGRFDAAKAHFLALLDLRKRQFGEHHPLTAWALSDYGGYLVDSGQFAAAKPVIEQAIAIMDATLDPEDTDATSPRYRMAQLYLWTGEWAKARELLLDIVKRRSESVDPSAYWVLAPQADLLYVEAELGLLKDASAITRIHSMNANNAEKGTQRFLRLDEALVHAALLLGKTDLADAYVRDYLRYAPPGTDPDFSTAMLKCFAGEIALRRNQIDDAIRAATECDKGLAKSFKTDHPRRQWSARLLDSVKTNALAQTSTR